MNTIERVHIEIRNWCELGCDVIICPTYPSFFKRYGLSGRVYRSAGENLQSECMELMGGTIGSVRITRSYQLVQYGIAWLIHAVPPRGARENGEEEKVIRSLYRKSLQLCIDYMNIYKEQIRRCASCYYQVDELESYLSKIDRYIKNHPIKRVAIIPIKEYANNKDRGARICLEAVDEFLKQDKKIQAVHIMCDNIATYNEYIKLIGR